MKHPIVSFTGYYLYLLFVVMFFCSALAGLSQPLRLYRYEGNKIVPSGSGAVVGRGNYILTAGHLITKHLAEKGASIQEQLCELDKIGAVFLSQKIKCKADNINITYIDGAILVPNTYFWSEVLDPGINPVNICKTISCLDDAYTYSSRTGFKEDVVKYYSNRSFRKGDSGSVIATKATNEAIGVYYGHGTTQMASGGYPTGFFFMLDNKPGMAAIIRSGVGKTTIKRMLPANCQEFVSKE